MLGSVTSGGRGHEIRRSGVGMSLKLISILGVLSIAGVLVCLSVEYVDKVLRVDDPVGAISVHGANGLWGVISVGLFADGKSNYGGSWNSVNGSVTGLFYGDAGQLVAQLIGVATLVGFVFSFSFDFWSFSGWFFSFSF